MWNRVRLWLWIAMMRRLVPQVTRETWMVLPNHARRLRRTPAEHLAHVLLEEMNERAPWAAEDLATAALQLVRYVKAAQAMGAVVLDDWPPHVVHGACTRIETLVQESARAMLATTDPEIMPLTTVLRWCDLHPEEMPPETTPEHMKALILAAMVGRIASANGRPAAAAKGGVVG